MSTACSSLDQSRNGTAATHCDTETGELNYNEAVKKMEEVLTKNTAALHLGHTTSAFERRWQEGCH